MFTFEKLKINIQISLQIDCRGVRSGNSASLESQKKVVNQPDRQLVTATIPPVN